MTSIQTTTYLQGVAPLPHLGIIRTVGADAASFLHNQLTNDVLLMKEGQSRLAAFCNAKGRMQASFVVYRRSAEEVLLICRKELIPQTVKRLSMFVLRAKAKLSDATEEFQLLGLAGDAAHAALNGASTEPWHRHTVGSADVLTLYPALGQPRALWIAHTDVAAPAGAALSADLWQVGEVMSGVAWVELATFEAFVPQMLNYESVDGVNFKKGCYPGQEVFSSLDITQPCGLVAQGANDGASHLAIVELQLSAAENSTLHLGEPSGPVLKLMPLPYALRDDI